MLYICPIDNEKRKSILNRVFMSTSWILDRPRDDEHFTFVYLSACSQFMINEAEKSEQGRFYNCMGSIVFSAFCIEAYLNQLGERKFSFWTELEQLNHKRKLSIIAQHINLNLDFSCTPFQSYNEIFSFRNLVAHAKPGEFLKFEKLCTPDNARKFWADAKEIITTIHKAAGFDGNPFAFMSFSSNF